MFVQKTDDSISIDFNREDSKEEIFYSYFNSDYIKKIREHCEKLIKESGKTELHIDLRNVIEDIYKEEKEERGDRGEQLA